MRASLRKLHVDLRRTDFFITHFHIDHFSLVLKLATEASTIYFNKPDMDIIDRMVRSNFWDEITHFTLLNGFPENELKEIPDFRAADPYRFDRGLSFKMVEDGDTITAGNHTFTCLRTSGHSEGHTCLFELDKKILLSGDHLLGDITPAVQLRSPDGNPLKKYLESLDRVYKMDIELVLPGHRNPFRKCKERIEELKNHHQERADEVISILEKSSKNAYQVASAMTWDVNCDGWDFFPALHKWFATGETMAHLKYLEEKDTIRKEMREQKIFYSLKT
jgi:glyoxylase-like metal-dependent hydrolase (beta-lactamase superfamily II)